MLDSTDCRVMLDEVKLCATEALEVISKLLSL